MADIETNIGAENNVPDNNNEPAPQAEPSTEDRLAETLAELKRVKRAFDKLSSDHAALKKENLASKSESERAAIEKAEKEAAIMDELNTLRKESAINKYAKSFLALGYNEKQAMKAAEAQFNGETDELFRIQSEHQSEYQKRIKAELMKTMPAPSIGNDDSISITQKQFDEMSYGERLKLYQEHPSVYAELVK